MDMTGFAGAVLTGGASRRLGSDKSTLVVGGVALAERVCRALRAAGAVEVSSVGGDADRLVALGCFDRHLVDLWPGEGPLGGIVSALESAQSDIVVVLACDTPSVGPDAPRLLAAALGDADVAVGVVSGRDQPLSAAWRRSTAARLRAAFAKGERAPRRVIASFDVVRVELSDDDVADIDRPEDLHRYDRRAASGSEPTEDGSRRSE